MKNTTMRSSFNLLLTCYYVLIVLSTHAQVNRRNTKSSVAYRANYQRISASGNQTFEIKDGTLWACGDNQYGQLGDGTFIYRKSAVQVGTDNKWISVSVAFENSFGLKSDGTLWAWGRNNNGQLGDGTNTDKNIPIQVGTDNNWISVSAIGAHSLGLKSDGTLWAWGYNLYGQLGDGTNTDKNSPIQVGTGTKWVSVSAGDNHCLGIKSDGTLWAWGYNIYGQLGDGTNTNKNSPIQVGTDNKWVTISASYLQSLALKTDGTLWAWGNNFFGQLGDGTFTDKNSPIQVGTDNKWISISAAVSHSLALKSDGTLWAWGNNFSGQLGDASNTNKNSPIQVGIGDKWISVATGNNHSLGLKSDGTLWAWGSNISGQLGDGTNIDKNSPIQVDTDNKWVDISASYRHSLGLKSDGTLWAWGWNAIGLLGDGTYTDKNSPIQIGADNKWIGISAGFSFSLGLKSDGTLWAWGENAFGQLGDGTNTSKNTPIQVGTDNNWVSITTGYRHSLGLKSDGTLWAWGYNAYGELGDGTNTNSNSPIQVGTGNKWISVATGDNHSLGLKSDGTLWAWGWNIYGQLGDGTITDKNSPVQIGTDNNWVISTGGVYHSLALKTDGTLWAWGRNNNGQLGDGSTTNTNFPIQIGIDDKWVYASAGISNSAGLKSDGTLWAWGYNGFGQFGDGTNTDMITPIQIGTDNNWVTISVGDRHNLGLKSDRTQYCATGNNQYGQLGNCTLTDQLSFVCIDLPISLYSSPINTIVCPGNFAAFSVSASTAYSYQWQENFNGTWNNLTDGGLFSGTSTANLIISAAPINFNSRKYRCILNTGTTCPPSITTDSATLSVITPQANISTVNGLTGFCVGNVFVLTATPGLGYTYKWYKSGVLLAGRTSDTLTINSGGSYTVDVAVSANCFSTSSAINITSYTKPPANITASGNSTICQGAFVTLTGNSAIGVSRQWMLNGIDIPNAIGVNYAADSSGIYSLRVTNNSSGCDSISNPIQVTVYPYPTAAITYNASPYTCTGNSAILTASQGIGYSYQWLLNGNTIAGATDSTYTATGTNTNSYSVIVKNAGNCASTSAATILNPIPLAPSICLVTVDSTSTNNLIYWEKTAGDTTIDSYYVYRDTSNNNFALIGIVTLDSLSLFVDTLRHLYAANGNPKVTSWRYKLAVKDICGTLSAPSLFHQTIFFQDQGNGIFSWSEYRIEGQALPVNQLNNYKIFRDSISDGNWKLIQTLSASSLFYNDIDYSLYPIGRWKVEGVWNTSCNPTARELSGVNSTRSNIKNKTAPNGITAYKRVQNKIYLHPNPATQLVFIKSVLILDKILILDYLGREVLNYTLENSKATSTSINISKLIAGLYTVVCKGKEFEVREKLVVE